MVTEAPAAKLVVTGIRRVMESGKVAAPTAPVPPVTALKVGIEAVLNERLSEDGKRM